MKKAEAIALLRNLEDSLDAYCELNEEGKTAFRMAIEALSCSEIPNNSDTISRQAAIDALNGNITVTGEESAKAVQKYIRSVALKIHDLPSAQLGQRYTNEELMIFQHGISLSLLSKRSAQHWRYDENTATEIKFLERLYEKVSANMRGEQDG